MKIKDMNTFIFIRFSSEDFTLSILSGPFINSICSVESYLCIVIVFFFCGGGFPILFFCAIYFSVVTFLSHAAQLNGTSCIC